jgi:hypothetical protein
MSLRGEGFYQSGPLPSLDKIAAIRPQLSQICQILILYVGPNKVLAANISVVISSILHYKLYVGSICADHVCFEGD